MQNPELSAGLMDQLDHKQTFTPAMLPCSATKHFNRAACKLLLFIADTTQSWKGKTAGKTALTGRKEKVSFVNSLISPSPSLAGGRTMYKPQLLNFIKNFWGEGSHKWGCSVPVIRVWDWQGFWRTLTVCACDFPLEVKRRSGWCAGLKIRRSMLWVVVSTVISLGKKLYSTLSLVSVYVWWVPAIVRQL